MFSATIITRRPSDIISQFQAQLHQQWQALLQEKAPAHTLAASFAIGTLISTLPAPGLDLVLIMLLVTLFKQLHKAATLAALTVWNALVMIPLYTLSFKMGAYLLQASLFRSLNAVFSAYLSETARQFMVGNLMLTLGLTAVSYLAVHCGLNAYRRGNGRC